MVQRAGPDNEGEGEQWNEGVDQKRTEEYRGGYGHVVMPDTMLGEIVRHLKITLALRTISLCRLAALFSFYLFGLFVFLIAINQVLSSPPLTLKTIKPKLTTEIAS